MGLKVDTIQNPSSSTVNLTLDTSGNATVGNNLTVTGGFTPASSFLRNRIINGAMQIFQRGTNLSTTATYGYYIDRMWGFSGTSTAATFSQVTSTGLAGFPYASRAQRNSGNTGTFNVYMGQIIESSNMVDLQSQTVTVSFYARAGANYSGASNALGVTLRTGTVADQGLATLISGWTGVVDQNTTVTLTTSWQRFTVNFTMPSNALEVSPFWYCATTGTAGANDYFDITGVQLEVGSVATPFERRLYGQELVLCQRYYQQITGSATLGYSTVGTGVVISATNAFIQIPFAATMRQAPTYSFTGTLTVHSGLAFPNITSLATQYTGTSSSGFIQVACSAGGQTIGSAAIVYTTNATANAFAMSSEL
jgi:hypothetical protein